MNEADGYVVIGTNLDTKNFDEEIKQTEDKLNRLEKAYKKALNPPKGLKANEESLASLRLEIQKVSNRLVDLREKQDKLNKANLSNILENMKNIGASTLKTVSGVTKWALSLFGIATIYGMLSSSVRKLSSENDQIKADIDYIQSAIASALQPVIERLIQLVYRLLTYVNYIAKAWFNVDLFANASAEAMRKSAKSAKELNKVGASFDKFNKLTDSKGKDKEGLLPSFDLSKPEDVPIPRWLQWIKDYKNEIIAGLFGIATGLKLIELGVKPLQSLGIGIAITGIVYSIMALMDYLKDPSWKNFGKIIQGIGIFIVGLGIAIASVPSAVVGAAVLIIGTIIKYWDKIKEFLQNGIDWLISKSDWIHEKFGDNIGKIYDAFVEIFQGILTGFDDVFTGLKQILDGIIQFVKGVFAGDWKMAWEGIKNIFSGIFTALGGIVKTALSVIINSVIIVARTVGQIIYEVLATVVNGILSLIESTINAPIKAINKLTDVINKIPGINLGKLQTFKLPRLAKGGIINMPGRGVNYGGANIGEQRPEGVIPLSDEMALEKIGTAIGKHAKFVVDFTAEMDGRVLARVLKENEKENRFARNGG